ncbi:MAG: NAD(P)H-dependent glycerol-3-phosphate dehydrogenase [Nitriliruptoraceae bacterium]
MGRVAVMGAGSWGTAFAAMSADTGEQVTLWARRSEVAAEVGSQHTNERYLPGVVLPRALQATADAEAALDGADVVVLAVPSTGIEAQLAAWGAAIDADATLVSLIKGVDVETLRFGSQLIADALDGHADRIVVVSGPNLARECAARQPAATVAAAPQRWRAERVQAAVMAPYFRVYTNDDRTGVEVAGAVKNVIAIAAGIAHGLGFGDNSKAAVLTRGLAEMTRLGVALGGQPLTFGGLAGVGDLAATCSSPQSRNRTVGERLGRGEPLAAIVASMDMVAEGVRSSRALYGLAQRVGVDMPITAGVVAVCHEGHDPHELVDLLLSREAKPELYGL